LINTFAIVERKKAEDMIRVVFQFGKIERFYGARGVERYISMDAGGAGQNVHLQAESLGLGTVIVGAFREDEVKSILHTELIPLYIMPVGRR